MSVTVAELEAMVVAGASARQLLDAIRPLFEAIAERREYKRQWMKKARGHHTQNTNQINGHVVSTHRDTILSFLTKRERKEKKQYLDRVVSTAFNEFYCAYPLKKAPEAARKAFAAALKRDAVAEKIIEGAKRYAAERSGQDPKYTKHPATWLNAGCWDDYAADEAEAAERARLLELHQRGCMEGRNAKANKRRAGDTEQLRSARSVVRDENQTMG